MQCAVDYSRASYGYAFLAGGLSSVFAYVHMQTVQRSYYDMISGSSVDANNQAAAMLARIPVRDILLSEWRNSTYRCATVSLLCLMRSLGSLASGQRVLG